MFDIVVNHVFSPGPANATDYSIFTPFNSSKYFHRPCVMDNSNETSVEVCQLLNDMATAVFTLPDIKTEDPEVREIFQEWIKDTVQKYNVDGLRLDTYKHVERDFWPDFIDAAGVFSVAEYLDGDPANYDSELLPSKDEGLLNYPTLVLLELQISPYSNSYGYIQLGVLIKIGIADSIGYGMYFKTHRHG